MRQSFGCAPCAVGSARAPARANRRLAIVAGRSCFPSLRAADIMRRKRGWAESRRKPRRTGDMDNASLTVERVEVAYGPVRVLNGVSPGGRGGRVRGPARLVGLRQDHVAARDLGLRAGAGRRDPGRRARYHAAVAGAPQHGHGVPVLCALAAHDDGAEPGLRAPAAARAARRARAARAGDRGAARPRGPGRSPGDAAVRRPAPARGARPRARDQPANPAARRAALQPRRAHPHDHAARDQGDPAAGRHHRDPRHPRPRGGDGDGGPDRDHERRRDRPDRAAGGGLQPPRLRPSSPPSWAPTT